MAKGQIITLDFLLATILVVFAIGVLMSFGEMRVYDLKDSLSEDILENKTHAAVIAFSGGNISGCEMNGLNIPFSYDSEKRSNITKDVLGLSDYNVSFSIGSDEVITGNLVRAKDIVAMDFDVVTCTGAINFVDLNTLSTTKVILRVGQ